MTLSLWYYPVKGRHYAYGLDSAGGTGRDYSSLSIIDPMDRRECVLLRSNYISHRMLAEAARELHEYGYTVGSHALVYDTSQAALVDALSGLFTSKDFYRQQEIRRTTGGGYGFLATSLSKTAALDALRDAIESRSLRWHNQFLESEANYWELQRGYWRYTLESGRSGDVGHGDVTMSLAMAWQGVLYLQGKAEKSTSQERVLSNVTTYDWSTGRTPTNSSRGINRKPDIARWDKFLANRRLADG